MIPKIKHWSYINRDFLEPLRQTRTHLLSIIDSDLDDVIEDYIIVLRETDAIADSLDRLLKPMRAKFPLSYQNCNYHALDEFIFNNPIDLWRIQDLKIEKTYNDLDKNNLVEFFNFVVEDVEQYSQIYFILCNIK